MRTISLSPATIDLVRLQRVRLTEAMLGVGLVYPEDGFLFPSTPEGTKPWRPDTWTHRFIRLRDGSACACAYTTFAISSPPPCSRPGWIWPPLPDASATGAAGRRPWPSTRTSYGSPIVSPPDLMASVLERQDNAAQGPLEANVVRMSKHMSKSG